MKFPYSRYGAWYMPVIPVTLRCGEYVVVTEALVDSGEASSLFDAQLAGILGIHDIKKNSMKAQFEGVSGHSITGYIHELTIEIGGHVFTRLPVAFSEQMPDNAVNILGQDGFFDLFPVKFTFSKLEVDLMIGNKTSEKS